MQKNRNKQINLNYLVYAKGKKNFQRKKKGIVQLGILRLPHCTYVGMSGLCTRCMEICGLKPSLVSGGLFYLLWI